MPAKTLEEVIGSLSGTEKTLFENTLKNNPELRDGWLRQDDYSRNQNALKAKEAEYKEAVEYSESMKAWADANVPRWKALEEKGYIDPETGEEAITGKMAELQEQLAEAKKQALAGGEMNPEELDRRVQAIVKDAGVLNKEELNAVIKAEAAKLATEQIDTRFRSEEEKFNKQTIPFVAGFSAGVAVLANHYEKETGKTWSKDNAAELYELMNKEQKFDALSVEEKFMESYRSSKKATEVETENARLKKENEELRARRSGSGLPGGGDEPFIPQAPGKGNISKMMERQGETPDFESVVMAQSVKAAKELAAEGKA